MIADAAVLIPEVDFTPAWRALRFVENPHAYFAGGVELTGTTRVLKATGVAVDFERLVAEGKLLRGQLDEAREIGKALHLATHYYDANVLKAGSVDPRVEGGLQNWIDFRQLSGFTPVLLETVLWDPGQLLAGTIDRAGFFAHWDDADPRDLYTVDLKRGSAENAGARWQTAAYASMLALMIAPTSPFYDPAKLMTRPRYSVELPDEGRYRLNRYDDTLRDWTEYKAFLTTFRRQHAQRQGPNRV